MSYTLKIDINTYPKIYSFLLKVNDPKNDFKIGHTVTEKDIIAEYMGDQNFDLRVPDKIFDSLKTHSNYSDTTISKLTEDNQEDQYDDYDDEDYIPDEMKHYIHKKLIKTRESFYQNRWYDNLKI